MVKSSRTTLHYVIQKDGARDLVLPPLVLTCDCDNSYPGGIPRPCEHNFNFIDNRDVTSLLSMPLPSPSLDPRCRPNPPGSVLLECRCHRKFGCQEIKKIVAAAKFPGIYGRSSITERPYFLGNIAASSIFLSLMITDTGTYSIQFNFI